MIIKFERINNYFYNKILIKIIVDHILTYKNFIKYDDL